MNRIVFFSILYFLYFFSISHSQTKTIEVDCSSEKGVINSILGVNRGPMNLEEKIDLTQNYRDMGITFIRNHDFYGPTDWWEIFPDWNADENDEGSYNFESSDKKIKAIIENGFMYFFRFGISMTFETPNPHVDPPGTIKDEDGNIVHKADRDDFKKFARICVNTIRHYNDGWNNGYHYNIEYWEIWNEPNLSHMFWSGTPEQYYILYEETARAIKNYNPNLIVGGPAKSGHPSKEYFQDFIVYCREHDLPLDFYSWHEYGTETTGGILNPYSLYRMAWEVRKTLDENEFTKAENIQGEWNAGTRMSLLSDSPKRAAHHASALIYFINGGVDYTFYFCGDILGGHGLHNEDGGLKISGYAFKAFKDLLEAPFRVEATGTDTLGYTVIAGKNAAGDKVRILISDFQSDNSTFELNVRHLPWGINDNFSMKRYVIDDGHTYELVETGDFTGNNFSTKRDMKKETVCLIKLDVNNK